MVIYPTFWTVSFQLSHHHLPFITPATSYDHSCHHNHFPPYHEAIFLRPIPSHFWPCTETDLKTWQLQSWFDITPVNKMASFMPSCVQKLRRFTLIHYITTAIQTFTERIMICIVKGIIISTKICIRYKEESEYLTIIRHLHVQNRRLNKILWYLPRHHYSDKLQWSFLDYPEFCRVDRQLWRRDESVLHSRPNAWQRWET